MPVLSSDKWAWKRFLNLKFNQKLIKTYAPTRADRKQFTDELFLRTAIHNYTASKKCDHVFDDKCN